MKSEGALNTAVEKAMEDYEKKKALYQDACKKMKVAREQLAQSKREQKETNYKRRLQRAIRLRDEDGLTFQEIGDKFGVKKERAKMIYEQAKRVEKWRQRKEFK